MSSFTKKAIVESFLRLVGKKPLDKITVRDIVDECGINRNTFYYHFQDIYAVLEEVCGEIFRRLPQEGSLSETLTCFLGCIGEFSATHPRSTHGLILSLGYDGLTRYIAPQMQRIVLDCLQRQDQGRTQDYTRHLTAFICHAMIGLSVDLLKAGGQMAFSDISEDVTRILDCLTMPHAENRTKIEK